MPHFAAIGFDHPPHSMHLRDRHRPEHRRFVLDNVAPIRMTGAMRDAHGNQCGTIYVFEAGSEAEVWEWVRKEPFYVNGVYATMRVVEWSPAYNLLEKCDWPT
ncbi:YciI family protein [Mesorhizobium sp. J428]|uniref:YciI family protein n=1 Tax=Mesorhizobium sp. J428 TaxID=2898440 RepID=UPI00215100BC|nr:YciI family protein [Mesorhizobium sp. J428]MCR5859685.1 YciI family protein [Mesorhizobium sp. J428]